MGVERPMRTLRRILRTVCVLLTAVSILLAGQPALCACPTPRPVDVEASPGPVCCCCGTGCCGCSPSTDGEEDAPSCCQSREATPPSDGTPVLKPDSCSRILLGGEPATLKARHGDDSARPLGDLLPTIEHAPACS